MNYYQIIKQVIYTVSSNLRKCGVGEFEDIIKWIDTHQQYGTVFIVCNACQVTVMTLNGPKIDIRADLTLKRNYKTKKMNVSVNCPACKRSLKNARLSKVEFGGF